MLWYIVKVHFCTGTEDVSLRLRAIFGRDNAKCVICLKNDFKTLRNGLIVRHKRSVWTRAGHSLENIELVPKLRTIQTLTMRTQGRINLFERCKAVNKSEDLLNLLNSWNAYRHSEMRYPLTQYNMSAAVVEPLNMATTAGCHPLLSPNSVTLSQR